MTKHLVQYCSFVLALFLAFTFVFPVSVFAEVAGKPSIVLLPITGQGLSAVELSVYRDALAESLGDRYDVKYGEQTDKIIEEVFKAHSSETLECDESKCYRDVATALNTSLVGKATVIQRGNNYHISVVVYNVYENKAVFSRTATCDGCNAGDLEAKLKETAGGKVADKGGVRWYWWVLGLLAAGGAASASGNSGSKTTTTPSSSNVPVTVTW
jgi:hypothetical protein